MLSAKSLFIEYYPLIIVFLFLVTIVGEVLSTLFKVKIDDPFFRLFFSSAIGCSFVVIVFALLLTQLKSILLGGLGLLILLLFLMKKEEVGESQLSLKKYFSRWDIFFVPLVVLGLRLINVDGGVWLKEEMLLDYVFYAKVSEFMLSTGVENPNINYLFFKDLGVTPYHYFDIWINSLAFLTAKKNPVISMVLLVHTFGILIIYIGFSALGAQLIKREILVKLFSFLFLFFSIFYFDFFQDIEFLKGTKVFSVNAVSYSKLFVVYWFLLLSFIFTVKKQYKLAVISALVLVFFYSSLAPSIFLIIGLTALTGLYKREKWAGFVFVVTICSFVWFVGFYFLFGSGVGGGGVSNFVLLEYLRTALNVFGGTFLQIILLLLPAFPLLILMKKKGVALKGALLVLPFFSALLVWSIFHRMHNAMQLFSNLAIPYLHVSIALITFYILSFDVQLKRKWLVALLIFVGSGNFIYRYVESKYSISEKDSVVVKRDEQYALQVANALDTLNNVGGYFRAVDKYGWATKSPVFGALDQRYQPLLTKRKGVHAISLSVLNTPLDSTSIYFDFESSLVTNSTFYQYLMRKKSGLLDVEEQAENFIIENQVQFLFTVGDVEIPKSIEPLIYAEIENPMNDERFYVLNNNFKKVSSMK